MASTNIVKVDSHSQSRTYKHGLLNAKKRNSHYPGIKLRTEDMVQLKNFKLK